MKEPVSWYPTRKNSGQTACEHCGGIIRHERWCITRDPIVYYAYDIVVHPEKLSVGDALILHSLGVSWDKNCAGACRPQPAAPRTSTEGPSFDL